MQTLMGGHGCARLISNVCSSMGKKKCFRITSGQPVLNISKLFCISPLDFTSTSSSVFLSPLLECVWRVFKRLQGSAKLDRVRCNEKHARESYDIKCHTNTPRQTLQSSSHSICLPSSRACNPSCRRENKKNGEPFGGWEKAYFPHSMGRTCCWLGLHT